MADLVDKGAVFKRACYGQLVVGPPGSGKSTYCLGMHQFLSQLGRKVYVVNLDPANESLPYVASVDIGELVTVNDVMKELGLGPNGAMMFCLDYLEKNFSWLSEKLLQCAAGCDAYFLFDCPGQVELYTHQSCVRIVTERLVKMDLRLTAMHLVDSHYCSDPANFISVLLTSLLTMVNLELPHVNILSKIDLVEQFGKLAFQLEFYTQVLDLRYLLDHLQKDPFCSKFVDLNEALIGLVEDYGLVSFLPLDIQDKKNVLAVVHAADKANGYIVASKNERDLFSLVMTDESLEDIGDKFLLNDETVE